MLKVRPDRSQSSQDTAISTVNPKLPLRKNQPFTLLRYAHTHEKQFSVNGHAIIKEKGGNRI